MSFCIVQLMGMEEDKPIVVHGPYASSKEAHTVALELGLEHIDGDFYDNGCDGARVVEMNSELENTK